MAISQRSFAGGVPPLPATLLVWPAFPPLLLPAAVLTPPLLLPAEPLSAPPPPELPTCPAAPPLLTGVVPASLLLGDVPAWLLPAISAACPALPSAGASVTLQAVASNQRPPTSKPLGRK